MNAHGSPRVWLPGASLALLTALAMVTPLSAQPPPPEGETPAPETQADAPEDGADESGEPPVAAEAVADGEAVDDPRRTGTTDTSEARTPQAVLPQDSEATDAGVPREALLDAGNSDASVSTPAALVVDAGVPADAGVAAAPAPLPTPAPTTTFVQVPVPFVPPTEMGDPWAGLREIIPGIPYSL